MRNPVNRLATAAPRALDSILSGSNKTGASSTNDKKDMHTSRTKSFDLDLSALDMNQKDGMLGESSSVVTFEELADIVMEDFVEGDEKWSV